MSSATVATKRRFSNDSIEKIETKKPKITIISNEKKQKKTNLVDKETGLSRCFHRVRAKMYLSLAPCYLEQPIEGLRQQHLDPLIMSYNSTVGGIIISYNNVRLSNENLNKDNENNEFKYVAKVADENPFSFVWALVDFIVWRPCIGDILEGYTIMQSQSHIGLLINDVFNASIKKFYIPEDWYFVPSQADESNVDDINNINNNNDNNINDNNNNSSNNSNNNSNNNINNSNNLSNFKSLGHWCDSNDIPVGGKIKFTVRAIHVNGKSLSIEGTLLTPDMERDSKPVMLDNIKDSIKKHVKFDGETTEVNSTNNNSNDDNNMNEKEMKEKLPEIKPLKDDSIPLPEINENDSSDSSDDSKDNAPKYNDDSSDSDKDNESDNSSSDSDNDNGSSSDSSD